MKNALLAVIIAGLLASPATAQAPSPDVGHGLRFGISFGGISTVALTAEVVRDSRSLEVSLGTWSFRDVSVSVVGKQYFGAAAARPVVGAGLWLVAAAPGDQRTGLALVARAPVGLDWNVDGGHALGAVLNVNRGLWVRRSDPEDTLPMNRRLVPLPELYYRYWR